MKRIRLDGITLSFANEVAVWWTEHGGSTEDISTEQDFIWLSVTEGKLDEIEALLQREAPEAMYQAVFPLKPGRFIPVLFPGPAFQAENIRRGWATGPNMPLSSTPAEHYRAIPKP